MRIPALGVAGLVLAGMAGCGESGPTDTTPEWVGVYTLQTINGQPLPFTEAVTGQTTQTTVSMSLQITTTLVTMALTRHLDVATDNSQSCTFTPAITTGVDNIDFLPKTGPCTTTPRYHHAGKTLTSVGGADVYVLTRP